MVINHKVTGKALPAALGLAVGCCVSLLITILSAVVLAFLVLGEQVPFDAVGYFAVGIHLIASAVGAAISAGTIKRRPMLMCLISGAVYYLVLLGCTAVFFGGQYQGMIVAALVVLIASIAVGWIASRGEKGTSKKYKKYRNR